MPNVSFRTRARRRVRRDITLGLATLLNRLPRRTAVRLGRVLGRTLAVTCRSERQKAVVRVADALELSHEAASELVERCASAFGGHLADALRLENMSSDELRDIVRLDGLEHLSQALERGHGAILLSAHIGNWEMLAAALSDAGVPLSVIGRKPSDPVYAERLERIRRRWGVATLWREHGARPIFRALENGRAVGALIDQATRVGSVRVPFFNRPAWTPVGPARIAVRTRAPVIPVHMVRRHDDSNRYIGVIEPEIVSNGDTPEVITGIWTARIEEWIRDATDSWVWMHDRWQDVPSSLRSNTEAR